MGERKALENQLFSWAQWNEGNESGDVQFYGVELVAPVREVPVGTKFPYAYLAVSGSFLTFMDEEK